MRKIYSLFSLLLVLLCTTGTATAQTSISSLDEAVEGTAYVIQSARGYLVYAPDYNADQAWCSDNSNHQVTVDESVALNQWTFIKSDKGNYYMLNVGSQKFIYTSGSLTAMTDTPTGADFGFVASTGGTKDTYPVNLSFGGSLINMHKANSNSITVYNFANDEGNMMSVRPVGTVEQSVIASAKEKIVTFEETLPTYVTTLDELSNDKVYYVRNSRGDWAWDPSFGGTVPEGNNHYPVGTVYSGENILVNLGRADVNKELPAENRQFAILQSQAGNYYIYSVGAKKFVSVSSTYENYNGVTLTEKPVTSNTELLSGNRGKSYPWVLAVDGSQIGVSNNYLAVGGIISFYNDLNDEGNCVALEEAEDFDATEALAIIEAFEAGPATLATVDPVSGEYDELPTTITITAEKALGEVEFIRLSTLVTGPRGAFLEEDPDNYKIDGNTLTINIPAEYLPYSPYATLHIVLKDEDGNRVALSEEEESIDLEYTTVISPDTYEASAITPAEGKVEKLDNFLITMLNPQTGEGSDFPGGFDTTKEITLTNAEGTTVATGTIDFAPEDMWSENVYVQLDKTITEAGTYTLTIPAGTIYNSLFDDWADDLGVEGGAIYNPELTFTFTIETATGINGATLDAANTEVYTISGVRVASSTKNLPKGVYVVNGKKVLVK